jgi:NADPH2 dehydrogenase
VIHHRGDTVLKYGDFRKLTSIKSPQAFQAHIDSLGLAMPFDGAVATGSDSPLETPMEVDGMMIGNRIVAQPMEGWDCGTDGAPTEATIRRWAKFGASGAKLIFGGEAAAIRPDGRANPWQLVINDANIQAIADLRETARRAHIDAMGNDRGWITGLQLTHSGRFCKPHDNTKFEPFILYRHPVLDGKFGISSTHPVMQDADISRLIEDYVSAAQRAQDAGFDFVDLKHCHGYLGHEFLSAKTRPGPYGGSLQNRTRFLREMVSGIRAHCPGLKIAVRLSALDLIAFKPGAALDGAKGPAPGVPVDYPADAPYDYGFGVDPNDPTAFDMTELFALFDIFSDLNIHLVNVTLGSPYYNPHLVRPAAYPPSDGYASPEDPLVGVMRHLDVVRRIKQARPAFRIVGSGYSYLQEYLPHVAQAAVRDGWTDFVGLGRMMLSYPEIMLDALGGRPAQRKKFCRTFSDCTTAPRNGIASGCYPLDPFYKESAQFDHLAAVKKAS